MTKKNDGIEEMFHQTIQEKLKNYYKSLVDQQDRKSDFYNLIFLDQHTMQLIIYYLLLKEIRFLNVEIDENIVHAIDEIIQQSKNEFEQILKILEEKNS